MITIKQKYNISKKDFQYELAEFGAGYSGEGHPACARVSVAAAALLVYFALYDRMDRPIADLTMASKLLAAFRALKTTISVVSSDPIDVALLQVSWSLLVISVKLCMAPAAVDFDRIDPLLAAFPHGITFRLVWLEHESCTCQHTLYS